MLESRDFRELLLADVVLMQGLVPARDVALAIQRFWEERARGETSFQRELVQIARINPAALERAIQEVEWLLREAGGDPKAALTRRGALDRSLHLVITNASRAAADALAAAGLHARLRPVPPDRYTEFEVAGEGGMGVVYMALDTELNRTVAFKMIRPDEAPVGVTRPSPLEVLRPPQDTPASRAFEELKSRFLQEAWITGGLEHPGIVPVYELGETPKGIPYYTMRFVRGSKTLRQALDEVRAAPFEERLRLLEPYLRLCDTVAYAHGRGVVHRDLKPENVAMGSFGEVVLLDWGLAKLEGRKDLAASRWQDRVREFREAGDIRTVAGALGTPGYMAPEAALGRLADVDARSDVYSLGVVLFEILTGRTPFAFRSYAEYVMQVTAEEAPRARSVEVSVPEDLDALCAAALAKDQAGRLSSAATLASRLRAWQSHSLIQGEIASLVQEARGHLRAAEQVQGGARLGPLDQVLGIVGRIRERRPDHPEAANLATRAKALRAQALEARASDDRRRLRRRAAAATLTIVAALTTVAAVLFRGAQRDAEDARDQARAAGVALEARGLAGLSLGQGEMAPERGLLLAAEAVLAVPPDQELPLDVWQAAQVALLRAPQGEPLGVGSEHKFDEHGRRCFVLPSDRARLIVYDAEPATEDAGRLEIALPARARSWTVSAGGGLVVIEDDGAGLHCVRLPDDGTARVLGSVSAQESPAISLAAADRAFVTHRADGVLVLWQLPERGGPSEPTRLGRVEAPSSLLAVDRAAVQVALLAGRSVHGWVRAPGAGWSPVGLDPVQGPRSVRLGHALWFGFRLGDRLLEVAYDEGSAIWEPRAVDPNHIQRALDSDGRVTAVSWDPGDRWGVLAGHQAMDLVRGRQIRLGDEWKETEKQSPATPQPGRPKNSKLLEEWSALRGRRPWIVVARPAGLHVWDGSAADVAATHRFLPQADVRAHAMHDDDDRWLTIWQSVDTGREHGSFHRLDLLADDSIPQLLGSEQTLDAESVVLAPDASCAMLLGGRSGDDGRLRIVDLRPQDDPRSPNLLPAHDFRIENFEMPSSGPWFVTTGGLAASENRRLWHKDALLSPRESISELGIASYEIAVAPSGRQIAWITEPAGVRLAPLRGVHVEGPGKSLALGGAEVGGLRFSRDGRVLMASTPAGVRVWEVGGGTEPVPFQDIPAGAVNVFAADPQGTRIASVASEHGGITLWRRGAEGAWSREYTIREGTSYESLALHPNGKWLVAFSDDALEAWDIRGPQPTEPVILERDQDLGHGELQVEFDRDGRVLAMRSFDLLGLRVLRCEHPDPHEWRPVETVPRLCGYSVKFDASGRWLAAWQVGCVVTWDANELPVDGLWRSRGGYFSSSDMDLDAWHPLPDGRRCVAQQQYRRVRRDLDWEVYGRQRATLPSRPPMAEHAYAFDVQFVDRRWLAATYEAGGCTIWNLAAADPIADALTLPGRIRTPGEPPTLVVLGADGTSCVFDPRVGALGMRGVLRHPSGGMTDLSGGRLWGPWHGSSFLIGARVVPTWLWNLSQDRPFAVATGFRDDERLVVSSSTGRAWASVSNQEKRETEVRVWNVGDGAPRQDDLQLRTTVQVPRGPLHMLLDRDGHWLLTSYGDSMHRLHDLRSGAPAEPRWEVRARLGTGPPDSVGGGDYATFREGPPRLILWSMPEDDEGGLLVHVVHLPPTVGTDVRVEQVRLQRGARWWDLDCSVLQDRWLLYGDEGAAIEVDLDLLPDPRAARPLGQLSPAALDVAARSSSGRWAVFGDRDGRLHVYRRLGADQVEGALLPVHGDEVDKLWIGADERWIASRGADEVLRLVPLQRADILRFLVRLAGRDLSQAEWQTFRGRGQPWRSTRQAAAVEQSHAGKLNRPSER